MKYLLFFSFICFSSLATAQDEGDTIDIDKPRRTGIEKYRLDERLAKYPFNKATAIKLASFGIKSTLGNSRNDPKRRIPLENEKVDLNKLDEIVDLTRNQIDTLSDILFNTCYKWTVVTRESAFCYIPRNAILFFDSENNNYAFIEICFGCRKLSIGYTYTKPEEEPCDETYRQLKAFFTRLGLATEDQIKN